MSGGACKVIICGSDDRRSSNDPKTANQAIVETMCNPVIAKAIGADDEVTRSAVRLLENQDWGPRERRSANALLKSLIEAP